MTTIDRFMTKVEKTDNCWNWIGSLSKDGYGQFYLAGAQRAHRIAYKLFIGHIPPGLSVLHKCDTPTCVNPEHLFLGTQADNMADMVSKNRSPHTSNPHPGEHNGQAKLTEADVAIIRDMYAFGCTQSEIAKRFKMSQAQINRICSNKSWVK